MLEELILLLFRWKFMSFESFCKTSRNMNDQVWKHLYYKSKHWQFQQSFLKLFRNEPKKSLKHSIHLTCLLYLLPQIQGLDLAIFHQVLSLMKDDRWRTKHYFSDVNKNETQQHQSASFLRWTYVHSMRRALDTKILPFLLEISLIMTCF